MDFEINFKINRNFSEYQNAVKQLQFEANLPQTGILSESSKKILSAGRCGNRDGDFETEEKRIESNQNRRVRRFAVGQNRWDTHRLTFQVRNAPFSLSQSQVRRAFRKALGITSHKNRPLISAFCSVVIRIFRIFRYHYIFNYYYPNNLLIAA